MPRSSLSPASAFASGAPRRGAWGTAHVGTPRRGSSHTWRTSQTPSTTAIETAPSTFDTPSSRSYYLAGRCEVSAPLPGDASGMSKPQIRLGADRTEDRAVGQVTTSDAAAAIIPPAAALNSPAPIIGMTIVWAISQSAAPHRIMTDDVKETIDQLANSLQSVTLLSTQLRRDLGNSAQQAADLEAAADSVRYASRSRPEAYLCKRLAISVW